MIVTRAILWSTLFAGILRHEEIQKGAATGVGNPVYYVGPGTGRDGLGGASFASRELTEESAEDRPAVQKGDPFMEKLLLEACLEMMAIPGLVVGIQDMGAAGLTCSTCETASRGNSGIEIDLDLVPQRETGMNSYEIMLSESQERMLVIVNRGRERELEEVFEKWDLHAARIGEVKEGDRMVVRHKGVVVADLPAKSLTDEAPVYDQPTQEPVHIAEARDWSVESVPDLKSDGVGEALGKLLVHPTIASKRWVWQQYDHMVMSGCTVEPGSDAGVVRLSIAGIDKYLAIANDCNNRFCFLDPYKGAQIAFAECMRLGLLGSSGFGGNRQPELRQPEQARGLSYAQGMREGFGRRLFVLRRFRWWEETLSLYNEHGQGAIDPTPVVSMVGLIDDAKQVTRSFVTQAGQSVLLIGGLPHELGGSYYLQTQFGKKEGCVPEIDLSAEKKVQDFLLAHISNESVLAAHDVSEGGLLVALAEMLFGETGLGFSLSFDSHGPSGRLDSLLFGESQGRVLLAVSAEMQESVLLAAEESGLAAQVLGSADESGRLKISMAGEEILDASVSSLRESWSQAIPNYMK